MPNRYIVTYDIADPKRLRRVFEAVRGFGDHLQYSVFRCDLTDQRRVELLAELHAIIDHDDDQVLLIDIGPATGRASTCIKSIGRPYSAPDRACVII